MPKYFNDGKIKEIVKRHNEIVDEMNMSIFNGEKIEKNYNLERELLNPKIEAAYNIGLEMKEKRDAQEEIFSNLKNKYKNLYKEEYGKIIMPLLKTDASEESLGYNDELFKEFVENPSKFIHAKLIDVLNTSAKELYELGDDPERLANYYKEHYELVEAADMMEDIINTYPDITLELQNRFRPEGTLDGISIGNYVDLIRYTKSNTMKYLNLDRLACPKLNFKQADDLVKSGHLTNGGEKAYQDDILDIVDRNGNLSPKEYLDYVLKDKMLDLKNEDKYIIKGLMSNRKNSAQLEREVFNVKAITNSYKDKYLEAWQEKFQDSRFDNSKFNIRQIEETHKGSFFERLFFRTSSQYKNMIKALKNYNNPNHRDYLNYRKLKNTAIAYKEHQSEQGYGENGKKLSGTSLIRNNLANTILEMENKKPEIEALAEAKFRPEIFVKEDNIINKEQFLKPEDIDEDIIEINDLNKNNEIVEEIEISNKL